MAIPKKHFRTLAWSLLIAMALYMAVALASDFGAIRDSVLDIGLQGWGFVLALAMFSFLLRFIRWQMYLAQFGHSVPVGYSLAYYVGAFTFTTSPGKAGEAIKSLYLKRHGVGYTNSLSAMFSELFLDVVVVILLSLLAGLAFADTRPVVIGMVLLIIPALPLIHSRRLRTFLGERGARTRAGLVRKVLVSSAELLRSSSRLLRAKPLYIGLGLGILAWGSTGLTLWVILHFMNIAVPLLIAISIAAISLLVGAASFISGGLGSTEAVMGLLLILSGVSPAHSIAATLIFRLGTLWFAIALGIVCLLVLELLFKEKPSGVPGEESLNRSDG